MRIRIRDSKTAIWARRLGRLALPLLVLNVLMHRFGLLGTSVFEVVALIAAGIGGAAVLLSLVAVIRLWVSGDHGWRNAFWGFICGGVCLLPFAYYGQLALRYPDVTDVSTASRSFLPLTFEPDTATMPPAKILGSADQLAAFPNVVTRNYPIAAVELHALVLRLIEQNGWEVRFDRVPDTYPGRINARITSIVGWREEAVFGIAATATGTMIDMRSASIGAHYDFGSNGNRIARFFSALDAEVATFLRDTPEEPQAQGEEDTAGEAEAGGQ